jgi:hypothetical protein
MSNKLSKIGNENRERALRDFHADMVRLSFEISEHVSGREDNLSFREKIDMLLPGIISYLFRLNYKGGYSKTAFEQYWFVTEYHTSPDGSTVVDAVAEFKTSLPDERLYLYDNNTKEAINTQYREQAKRIVSTFNVLMSRLFANNTNITCELIFGKVKGTQHQQSFIRSYGDSHLALKRTAKIFKWKLLRIQKSLFGAKYKAFRFSAMNKMKIATPMKYVSHHNMFILKINVNNICVSDVPISFYVRISEPIAGLKTSQLFLSKRPDELFIPHKTKRNKKKEVCSL